VQAQKKGTAFVEVVSTCSSGWKLTPVASNKWMEENMFPFYPLGDLKDGAKADAEEFKVRS
jgi:2-oxoglutarate ferredoxin oxidoreductase subunit beta